MKILTAAEMREADRLTGERYGISGMDLMERAGEGVVARLQREYPDLKTRRITVLCGKGNNGGDGFVVARLLKSLGADPSLVLFGDAKDVRGDAGQNLKRWSDGGGKINSATDAESTANAVAAPANAEIIVDAML